MVLPVSRASYRSSSLYLWLAEASSLHPSQIALSNHSGKYDE